MGMEYSADELASIFVELEGRNEDIDLSAGFKVREGYSGASFQIYVSSLFDEVIREVIKSPLGERPKKRALQKIKMMRVSFHETLMSCSKWRQFKSGFDLEAASAILEDISDLMQTSGLPKSADLDRELVEKETQNLIRFVEQCALPNNRGAAVLIHLRSTFDLISTSSRSDAQICDIIKASVADLLVEIENLEGDQTKLRERVIHWGKETTKATAFALGFLMDGSAAVQMIAASEPVKALSAPVKQITSDDIISVEHGV